MKLGNIAWNIAGLAVPSLVAALTIPSLINLIGMERFGLLSLAWGLMNYSGVFDLGIGRAATHLIAKMRGQKSYNSIAVVISTATRLTFLSAMGGFLLLVLAVLCGVQRFIHHSAGLESEITASLFILALTIPIQAFSATFRGINEAFENFIGISLLRMVLGILNFLGPYITAHYTSNLAWLVVSLLASRLMALTVFRYLSIRCVNNSLGHLTLEPVNIDRKLIKKRLLSFGGWFTVSGVISPILVQADRFVISGVISAIAVATYTIPYEVVVQLLILVGAVSSVMFPSLSKLIHEHPDKWQTIFNRWSATIIILMFVVTSVLAFIFPFILPMWIGAKLPSESVLIGQILCIGAFANSIGAMYFTLLHAQGRAEITAKLHLFELPIFIGALYLLIGSYGVYGAAWAWVGRMVVDLILLKIFSRNILYSPRTD